MDEKRGLKALETWAKRVTNGYNDVKITDMSSSWRSGLGFCAIVHHYRPDLIDYDSLSKENILHNNSLAFSVAEKQLGVPALLDAEDMEKFSHLDRLSIITYLSQLYNFFENQNRLNKTKPAVKRILSEGKTGPPSKISTSDLNISTGRKHDVCQTCKHRVYILERLIVSGKLYHRTCFKCFRCNTILKPGAYVEGETEGTYECAICPQDEVSETDSSLSSVDVTESAPTSDTAVKKHSASATPKLSLLTSSVDTARNSFLKRSLSQQINSDSTGNHEYSPLADRQNVSNRISPVKTPPEIVDQPRTSISVKDRISAFECNGSFTSSVKSESDTQMKLESDTKVKSESDTKMKSESDTKMNRDNSSPGSSNLSLHSISDNESPTSTHKPYESVLLRDRSPRPLARLKLDIPTRPLSESKRRFSSETLSSQSPGLKSADSVKSVNYNFMPVIKSPTYSLTTLPRQNSLSSFTSKDVPSFLSSTGGKINSEESLNSLIHDRWSRTGHRGSLEFEKRNLRSLNHSFLSVEHPISEKSASDELKPTHQSAENLQITPNISFSTTPKVNDFLSVEHPIGEKSASDELKPTHQSAENLEITPNISFSTTSKVNDFLSVEHPISEKSASDELKPTHQSAENLQSTPNISFSTTAKVNDSKLNNLSLPKLKIVTPSVTDESLSPKSNAHHSFLQRDSVLSGRTSLLSQYKISLANKEKDLNVTHGEGSPVITESKSDSILDELVDVKQEAVSLHSHSKEINETLSQLKKTTTTPNIPLTSNIPNENTGKKSEEKSLNSEISLTVKAEDDEDYPDDLNPFGDDEEGTNESPFGTSKSKAVYPDDLNPFGDSDEEVGDGKHKIDSEYDESMNPFASDDEATSHSDYSLSAISRITPVPAMRTSLMGSPGSSVSPARQYSTPADSPTGSLRGTLKKRQAPKPPSVRDIFRSESVDLSNSASLTSSPLTSLPTMKSPSPKPLKSKPAPPPPPSPSVLHKVASSDRAVSSDDLANFKQMKDMDNLRLKSSDSVVSSVSSSSDLSVKDQRQAAESKEWKKKKRPAPPVPIPRRREIKKIPLREILSEMTEIELKQEELEKHGRELEVQIRDKDKDEEPTVEEEELIMQLFELVNQKNALFRRQAELMYIKRSQKLEEEQADLEYQIRCLMQKPASQKTSSDVAREERLVQRLLDVVDQRNEIIDSIEMDRKREAVEDSSVQEQMDVKNSDLTITAEIKEKGLHKHKKKHKEKKEKRKQKNQEESKGGQEDKPKKSGHHKKKWF